MTIDLATVEHFVVILADGTAAMYPPSAPVIAIIKGALSTLEAAGVIPEATPAVNVELLRMQAAGIAARAASAVEQSRHHATPQTPTGDAAAAPGGATLESTVK